MGADGNCTEQDEKEVRVRADERSAGRNDNCTEQDEKVMVVRAADENEARDGRINTGADAGCTT